MQDKDAIWPLIAVFVPFSLASVGGGTSIFAGIQHQAVDVQHWVTSEQFVEMFAISRAAPGPGSMLVTLIGWKVAGWIGALTATLALFLPSSLLIFGIAKVWSRFRGRSWHTALENGLAPIGVGLTLAGVLAIARIAGFGPLGWAVAGGSAVLLGFRPKMHPLLLLAGGALIFALWQTIVIGAPATQMTHVLPLH